MKACCCCGVDEDAAVAIVPPPPAAPGGGADAHINDHIEDHAVDHGHDHGHDGDASSWRGEAVFLVMAGLWFAAALLAGHWWTAAPGPMVTDAALGVLYLAVGWPIFRHAAKLMRRGDLFNEFTLMGGASLAAMALGEWPEAVGVLLFYRVGEFFQDLAANRSRRSIRALLATKPTTARRLEDGVAVERPVGAIVPGDRVVVRPGERIPLDGVVIAGESTADTSPLTGESIPVPLRVGDEALAGSINRDALLTVEVRKRFADTHMARILELVEHAAANKSPTERFITRFARRYTPAVTAAALLVAVVPPLAGVGAWSDWIYRGLVVLIVSCPCALVISIPLAYFGGLGRASHYGLLVKGGYVFDALRSVRRVVFDKTGTLTRGEFHVAGLSPAAGVGGEELLRAAATAEAQSNHPIARSIRERAGDFVPPPVKSAREEAGRGVAVEAGGRLWLAGSPAWLTNNGVPPEAIAAAAGKNNDVINANGDAAPADGTVIQVAVDGRYLGALSVADRPRDESAAVVAALKERGLGVRMLTGDRESSARALAARVGIDDFRAELLPADKVAALGDASERDVSLFVGDGLNDAPVLSLARVGVAMGGVGQEAAIEAADAVILNDSPARVETLFLLGDRVRRTVSQNIVLALGVKAAVMVFGVAGLSGLWEAVFADVGVAILALANAIRGTRL